MMKEEYRFIYSMLKGHFDLLSEKLGDVGKREAPVTEKVAEYIEQASIENDWELQFFMRKRMEQQRKEMADAIKRMEDETYGICLGCGDEIDLHRLIAKPTTRYCLRCQSLKEKTEKKEKLQKVIL